jgi:hypothetical protein
MVSEEFAMNTTLEEEPLSQTESPEVDDTKRLTRLQAIVVALALFVAGLVLIIVGAILPQGEGLWYEIFHHLLRDLGIAAIISALLGSAYEFALRRDFVRVAREALRGAVRTERDRLTQQYIETAKASLTDVLAKRDQQLRQLEQFRAAGVRNVRKGRNINTIEEHLNRDPVPEQVRILETWTGYFDEGLDDLIRTAVKNGTKEVRILLLDPESDHVRYRAAAMNYRPDTVRSRIEADLEKLQELREELRLDHEDKVKIKVYDASPSVNMFCFDDTTIFGLYLRNIDSLRAPQFTVGPTDDANVNTEGQFTVDTREYFVAKQLESHFESLWEAKETTAWPPDTVENGKLVTRPLKEEEEESNPES